MIFRKGRLEDIDTIHDIIKQAQEYFKNNGINQWQNNYPNLESIHQDINNDLNYVLTDDDKVLATVSVIYDGEKTYDNIYKGKWLTEGSYAAIHRIAVDEKAKGLGLASRIIKNIEDLCFKKGFSSIRVDTHKDNLSMQRMLDKNGFIYCGIIYLENGDERVAYEKELSSANQAYKAFNLFL